MPRWLLLLRPLLIINTCRFNFWSLRACFMHACQGNTRKQETDPALWRKRWKRIFTLLLGDLISLLTPRWSSECLKRTNSDWMPRSAKPGRDYRGGFQWYVENLRGKHWMPYYLVQKAQCLAGEHQESVSHPPLMFQAVMHCYVLKF